MRIGKDERPLSWTSIVYGLLVAGVIIAISILALVPPVCRDDLIHHLAIPKLYLRHGSIYEIPHLSFSYYPMNLDLLYMIPLYFNNDILPKFIHFTFAIITSWMVFGYLKKRIHLEYALLGSLFFLSLPIIVYQSSIAYVDLGLVCFLFGALIYIFKWIQNDFKTKYLIVSAVLCGLALGTKYNGLIGLFLLTLFIPAIYARYHASVPFYALKAIGYSGIFFGVAVIVFSPWMIRNFIWKGNPIYPLYHHVFHTNAPQMTISEDQELENKPSLKSHLLIRRDLYGESDLEIALLPIRVFFQGKDNDPKYFDGRANPFLLLLPMVVFFYMRSDTKQVRTEKFLMLWFSILFLLFACAQTVIRIRYFAPIFPPLVILSMFGLYDIETKFFGKNSLLPYYLKKTVCYSIIILMLGLNVRYIIERFNYVQPFDYLSGKISRDEYIQKYRPEYASMQYANRHLTKNDRILGVYLGNRSYYSDIDIVFSLDMLKNLAAKAKSPEDISKGLKEKGITYLLVNYELFNFWVKEYNLHEKQMLKEFFEKYTKTEFSKDKNGLLRLL